MKNLSSFKDLVDDYDYFLFDQWGVLHNGHKKFDKAEKCLEFLKERSKKVVLISNSSLPSKFSISNLKRIGISESLYTYCITSGQIALDNLKKDIYKKYGSKCFPLRLPKEKINYFNLDIEKNASKANFGMIADIDKGLSILDFSNLLDSLMKNNLPLLCSNPDYLVDDDNRLSMCGGTIAQLYEDMGGKVYRYGKPYEPIYLNIEKKMKIKHKKKVLVIGDSLWHDICGGLKMGYDRLWIKKGIHKTQLKNNAELKPLLEQYPPTFAQNELKL